MVLHRRISGSALRWERMHRDAAKALAAQAAEAMATRATSGLNPPPAAREGAAGEPVLGVPISEQDQGLELRANAHAARRGQDSSGV
ncbi:hypothetical protein AKJ13_15845 [Methylobacterium sp. ARG-1]|nr:hypothetical protein AKJ13_15845 [Methylobacterium sp. ARG-1]